MKLPRLIAKCRAGLNAVLLLLPVIASCLLRLAPRYALFSRLEAKWNGLWVDLEMAIGYVPPHWFEEGQADGLSAFRHNRRPGSWHAKIGTPDVIQPSTPPGSRTSYWSSKMKPCVRGLPRAFGWERLYSSWWRLSTAPFQLQQGVRVAGESSTVYDEAIVD